MLFPKVTVPVTGMITIPAASLAGAQIVQTGGNTNTTNSGQGTVTVTLPVTGNVMNSGGMVMVRTGIYCFGVIVIFFVSMLVSACLLSKSSAYVDGSWYRFCACSAKNPSARS